MRPGSIIPIFILITSCTTTEVVTKHVPIEVYHPELPRGLNLSVPRFSVVTSENLEEKIKEFSISDREFVFYAISPMGYERLSYNIQEFRRLILEQRAVIEYYRKAYPTTSWEDKAKELNKDTIEVRKSSILDKLIFWRK